MKQTLGVFLMNHSLLQIPGFLLWPKLIQMEKNKNKLLSTYTKTSYKGQEISKGN